MFLLNFLLLIFATIFISAEFHNCFDRYGGYKIIGGQFIQPFHSEWRIGGGEERCIEFCIRSLSRCASIVFDKYEHICHYFTIGNINNIVQARGFVYLQLKSRECVGQNANKTSTIIPPIIIKPRKEENPPTIEPTTEKTEPEKQQKVEEFLVNKEQIYSTKNNEKKDEEESKDSRNFLEEIDKELQQMEEENENLKEEEEDNSQQSLEESNLMPTVQMLKIDKRPKQLGEEPEIRRHPRLDNYKTNYWKNQERKDNSGKGCFSTKIIYLALNRPIKKIFLTPQGCGIGRQPIWLAVENARFSATEFSINSETAKECAKFCSNNTKINFIDENGRNKRCNAFSFNENEKKCEPAYSSIEFPSSLVQLSEADFTQRAFRRLCYSENFYPFTGCSDFVSFMDYRLSDIAISPKELYDGLPKNVQGLSACIELCVLANDFECLSGFFDALNGKCALYDVNSLSNPSSFCKHSGNGHQLYFENGCAETDKNNIIERFF